MWKRLFKRTPETKEDIRQINKGGALRAYPFGGEFQIKIKHYKPPKNLVSDEIVKKIQELLDSQGKPKSHYKIYNIENKTKWRIKDLKKNKYISKRFKTLQKAREELSKLEKM